MPHETPIDRAIRGELQSRGIEAAVAVLATRQHGVVARRQLLSLGIGHDSIDRRIGRHLHPVFRGVYAVGHRNIGTKGMWMAAVLACGEGAVLSHRSAAELWGMRRPSGGRIDVTSPRHPRGNRSVRAHSSPLPSDELTVRHGIPVTTAARTLLDLGQVLGPAQVEAALNEAEVLRLADETGLAALLERYPRRAGTAATRRWVAAGRAGARITKSVMEERFHSFVAKYRLPIPIANGVVEGLEVDCHWPAARLVVELDSRKYHRTRRAFERDRERDRILLLAGWRVVRVTWTQLTRQPARLAADISRLLAPACN